MKITLLSAALTVAFAFATTGLAAETPLTIADHIPGILTLPDKASGKVPVVLMLHSFGSSKNEWGGLFKNLAAKLAEQGIASLRIDFQGSGDSKIPFEKLTFTNQVTDAQAAINYLKTRTEVDSSRLGVLGFSLGGGVAITLTKNPANNIKSLALWSSVSNASLPEIEASSREQAEKAGKVEVDLGFRKVVLGKDFYASLQGHDLEAELRQFKGNTLLVYGGADDLAGSAPYYFYNLHGQLRSLMIVDGADHVYMAYANSPESQLVMNATNNWFSGLK